MKYLKKFESNSDLYQKLTSREYSDVVSKIDAAKPATFDTFNAFEFKIIKRHLIANKYTSHITGYIKNTTNPFILYKLPDYYYIFTYYDNKKQETKSYKCDSIDGLIQLFNNII